MCDRINKKELINRLTLLRYDRNIEAIQYKFYNRAINSAISVAEELEEIEKPVVPQCVADWYEEHKKDFEGSILALCVQVYEDNIPESIKDWVLCSDNKPIQTLVNMYQYSYTIEKESLFKVFLKKTGIQLGVITPKYGNKSQFTKEELKEYGLDNSDIYGTEEVQND